MASESSNDRREGKHRPDEAKETREAVATLEASGRRVQIIGRFVDGRLELDQDSLNEMTKKFPNADMAFVAVNAPFDPTSERTG
jgi:hypothetical protein